MKSLFDFPKIKEFATRPDFKFSFDAMSGISGIYAKEIFGDELGIPI